MAMFWVSGSLYQSPSWGKQMMAARSSGDTECVNGVVAEVAWAHMLTAYCDPLVLSALGGSTEDQYSITRVCGCFNCVRSGPLHYRSWVCLGHWRRGGL